MSILKMLILLFKHIRTSTCGSYKIFSYRLQIQILLLIIFVLSFVSAGPNPITDNESDDSNEADLYRYPNFRKISEPYWKAYPKETQEKLKRHDHLELNVLAFFRPLDFKLREAWTRTDKPFSASH